MNPLKILHKNAKSPAAGPYFRPYSTNFNMGPTTNNNLTPPSPPVDQNSEGTTKPSIGNIVAVVDLCMWKDKKKSGVTLVMATLFWYTFEITESRLVPFLCSILLLFMLSLFLWANFGQLLFTWRPPTPEEIKQADSPVRALFAKIEGLLFMLYEIAYGKDIKTFLLTIVYVAIIDSIGCHINFLTILYIWLLCSMTIPVLYHQYRERIDSFIGGVSKELGVVTSNVINNIPRATKVD